MHAAASKEKEAGAEELEEVNNGESSDAAKDADKEKADEEEGPAIKEVRLHLCQKSAASAGAREFVEKHYVPLKLANPK